MPDNQLSRPSAPTDPRHRKNRIAARAAVVVGTLVLAVSLSGCSSLFDALSGRSHGRVKAWDFSSGAEGKERGILADWIPDGAHDVHLLQRTTGDERIVTMRGTIADLPRTCKSVSSSHPLTPYPQDHDSSAEDYRTTATIEADWWKAGQEKTATKTCGKWWVGQRGDQLWGFTPELRSVTIEPQG